MASRQEVDGRRGGRSVVVRGGEGRANKGLMFR